MRPSLLKPGEKVSWQPDEGVATTRRITFIERILGNGLSKTTCWFKARDLGTICMSDYDVSRRIKR